MSYPHTNTADEESYLQNRLKDENVFESFRVHIMSVQQERL